MPIYKIKGQKGQVPPRPAIKNIFLTWIGSFLFVAILSLASESLFVTLLLGSFGASCVLVFGYPEAPFSQPRNIIGGHLLSALVALALYSVLGYEWWALSLSVSTCIVLMMVFRIVHPPAGSNPIIIFLTMPNWDFLIFPILGGALLIVLFALIYNNLVHKKSYPLYW